MRMVAPLQVSVSGDNCWPELKDKFTEGKWVGIARMSDATISGRSTVTVRIEMPDGSTVLAQTTLRNLVAAVQMFLHAESVGD